MSASLGSVSRGRWNCGRAWRGGASLSLVCVGQGGQLFICLPSALDLEPNPPSSSPADPGGLFRDPHPVGDFLLIPLPSYPQRCLQLSGGSSWPRMPFLSFVTSQHLSPQVILLSSLPGSSPKTATALHRVSPATFRVIFLASATPALKFSCALWLNVQQPRNQYSFCLLLGLDRVSSQEPSRRCVFPDGSQYTLGLEYATKLLAYGKWVFLSMACGHCLEGSCFHRLMVIKGLLT